MRMDNPAAMPCDNIDKGPEHAWMRRADGTSECRNCGVRLDPAQNERRLHHRNRSTARLARNK